MNLVESFVRSCCLGDASGHDWWHIARVRGLALKIASKEGGNLKIIENASLLHDAVDWKFHTAKEQESQKKLILELLQKLSFSDEDISHILEIMDNVSFKGSGEKSEMRTLEGQIVQDADRLDALGAIGVARTFAYGGNKGQAMHDPLLAVNTHHNFEEYKNKKTTSINHFYEKLFLLKDLMNTETAKSMAIERHEYMQGFVDRFLSEWEGNVK